MYGPRCGKLCLQKTGLTPSRSWKSMEPQYDVAMTHRAIYTDPVPATMKDEPKDEQVMERASSASSSSGDDEAKKAMPFYFMPVEKPSTKGQKHRPHEGASHKQYMGRGGRVMIAKQLNRREWQNIPKAKAAVAEEWNKLIKLKCWDNDSVAEYQTIRHKAVESTKTVHFGRLFELCHIKHSELAE